MVNAGELFAGAVVGGAFGPVFDVFREAVEKTFEFNPTLESVKSTVDALELLIPKIEGHNNALGGNRAGEVEKLKQTMAEGGTLIKELLDVNEWSCLKAHYTDQLVVLDESLKRHLEMLKVQGVIDVKEALVEAKDMNKDVKEGLALTKDIGTDVKEALVVTKDTSKDVKEGLIVTKDTSKDVKEGLIVTKDTSEDVKEGLLVTKDTSKDVKEALALTKENTGFLKDISVTAEENTNQLVRFEATFKAGLSDLQKALDEIIEMRFKLNGMENKVGSLIEASLQESYEEIGGRTRGKFEVSEWKRAENKEVAHIPTEELINFTAEIEKAVELVRKCTNVLDRTDDLKSENNEFHHLEKTLKRLNNRLNGIHPFKRNTGKCCWSCGTTSMKDSDIINDNGGGSIERVGATTPSAFFTFLFGRISQMVAQLLPV